VKAHFLSNGQKVLAQANTWAQDAGHKYPNTQVIAQLKQELEKFVKRSI